MTSVALSSRRVCCSDAKLGVAEQSDASGAMKISAVYLSGQVGGGDDDACLLRASGVKRRASRVTHVGSTPKTS